VNRPKLYLLLCVIALLVELTFSIAKAPPPCVRCGQPMDPGDQKEPTEQGGRRASRELPEMCEECVEFIRRRLNATTGGNFGTSVLAVPYNPPYPIDPADPLVKLETSRGTVVIELFSKRAPISTDNFLRYARAHAYDDVIFHRIEDYLCVTGRLRGGYSGQPLVVTQQFPPIKSESRNGLQNRRGTVQLPRQDASQDTATGDFCFNYKDNYYLDWKGDSPDKAGYCVFGQVVRGFEVLDGFRGLPDPTNEQLKQWGEGYAHMKRDPVKVIRAYEVDAHTIFGTVALLQSATPGSGK
jgi:cyclophilin family peptidyl-prolyl cis-trans isomerase